MESTDGYYFRDNDGKVNGPMSKEMFDHMRGKGKVTEGMRAWRTVLGSAFKVNIERKFICSTNYLFSGSACNHAWELCSECHQHLVDSILMFVVLSCRGFSFSLSFSCCSSDVLFISFIYRNFPFFPLLLPFLFYSGDVHHEHDCVCTMFARLA